MKRDIPWHAVVRYAAFADVDLPVPRPKLPQGWLLFRGLAVLLCLAVMPA